MKKQPNVPVFVTGPEGKKAINEAVEAHLKVKLEEDIAVAKRGMIRQQEAIKGKGLMEQLKYSNKQHYDAHNFHSSTKTTASTSYVNKPYKNR